MATLQTMYPGKANSPVTELVAGITDIQTSFDVLDGNALPDAPNIATIGQGDTAETIQYGGKSGNTLTNVTRGFEGAARSWAQGTKLARNFTAYDYDTMRTKLEEGQLVPTTIKRGSNVINTSQASGATFKVLGCTRCNILGKDGGCESLATFATSGSGTDALSSFEGIKSIKFTSSPDAKVRYKDYAYTLDQSKYYLLGCWVYVESYTSGTASLALRDIATNTPRHTAAINTSIIGQKQFVYTKVPLSNTLGNGFRLYFGIISSGTMSVHFGAIRLFELSAADYAAIGTTITGDAIDAYLPYVDSVQHLRGVSIRKTGKNLLPPFTQWSLHANAEIVSPYEIKLNATAADQKATIDIILLPSTTYKFTFNTNGRAWTRLYNFNMTAFSNSKQITSGDTITTDATYYVLRLELYSPSVGTFTFSNPQLELGSVATPFEPRVDQYANCPVPLASNLDRSIADSYDSAIGQVFRRWAVGVKLDGMFSLSLQEDKVGMKLLMVTMPMNATSNIVRWDGKLFRYRPTTGWDSSDLYVYEGGALYFTVSDTDSGWTESLNPSANAIKALMNGWKANGNDGTVYNSWVSILTGTAPATNTEAYVAANKAPGWEAWATLDYVLATPVVEQLEGDLGGLSLDAGGNAVELLEGVVVRERVNPVKGTGANTNKTYYINYNQVTTASYEIPSGSQLKLRTNNILGIYKDRVQVYGKYLVSSPNTHGGMGAAIPEADFDPTAEYFVDYIVLDRYAYTANAVDATLTYQSTLGGAVAQATQDIAQLKMHNGVQDFALDYIQAAAENTAYDLAEHEASVKAQMDDMARTLAMGGMV